MREYRQCTKCIMDTTAEEITFDNLGVCNFCHQAQKSLQEIRELGSIPRMKGKKYDCLLGLSGGVDSSTCLHYLVQIGVRPLCFSVDNGWNDPKADENIMRMVEKLEVPFYRYTIDLDKFRELQKAFLQSGTKNIEIPTDHILMATSYELADKYGIKWIVSGGNVATESIMPRSWGYQPRDLIHIKAIYEQFTGKKLKGLPTCGLLKWNWYKWIKRIKILYLLDYLKYNREESIIMLEREYGYKPYGDKHCESQWTTWFQNFYLYEKFGIDKRKAHYSSLINSGQMTRDDAIERIKQPPIYPELGIEKRVMQYPKHSYKDYPNDELRFNKISSIIRTIRGIVK